MFSASPQTSTPPSNLKPILDAALSDYKRNTGKELLDYPLATELQRCGTVDAVLAILQDQSRAFQQFKDGDQGLMKWIGPLVQVIFAFSGTLVLGDVGQVLFWSLIRGGSTRILTLLHTGRRSPPKKQLLLESVSFLLSVPSHFGQAFRGTY